jgi:hypothetical protein
MGKAPFDPRATVAYGGGELSECPADRSADLSQWLRVSGADPVGRGGLATPGAGALSID